MNVLLLINKWISIVFLICYSYQFVYIPIGLLYKKKRERQDAKMHNYAILVCGRNEEAVIGDLLDSINNQTYPKCLLHTFVMADNCTDDTALIAKNKGAIVYSRYNMVSVGKGYALEALLRNIKKDFGNGFDGYLIFDADNVLASNYIEEMNKTFCKGYTIVTGYRNSKNYGDNWISAGYGLWFIRECRFLNGVRSQIGSSCCVGGTGFMFSKEILERMNGWNYHLLTEDIEFSIDQITKGERIGYCSTAELFDEQPTDFTQSVHQRMRWAKGYLQVLKHYGIQLIMGISHWNFSCFDMLMSIMPAFILSLAAVICNACIMIVALLKGQNVFMAMLPLFQLIIQMYSILFLIGLITTIVEWRSIRVGCMKKILYCFSFPIFMFTYLPISFMAMIKRVEWVPITHRVKAKEANIF